MPTRRRRNATGDNIDPLLQSLLAEPTPERALAPVALRSAATQRTVAFRGWKTRTWVDSLLGVSERLLMLAAIGIFSYWLLDGPVRDYLHMRQKPAQAAAIATATVHQPLAATSTAPAHSGQPQRAAALPFIRPEGAAAPATDDFIVPRGSLDVPSVTQGAPQPNRLQIPAISLDTPVQETFVVDGEWQVAEYAAGFLNGTALPGNGNTALAGHAGIRGAVFRDLGQLNPGDEIMLDAAGWRYTYHVRDKLAVWPEQVEILDQTPTPVLTLITCTNWDTQRLVVVADLVAAKPLAGD